MIALLLAQAALAQSCSCSVGSSDTTLPIGNVLDSGAVVVNLDYGLGQTGGETWEGVVSATDLQGNSMAGMAMPGHRTHSARLTGTVGLPRGFSASVVVPAVYSAPLYPSEMPGDVSRGLAGDVAVGGRWGMRRQGTFVSAGLAGTLPTGTVIRGVGVRGGRGAFGVSVDGSALQMVSPRVGIAGRVAWAQGLQASPVDDYLVGPQLDGALGARVWTREQGRLSFVALGGYLHKGHDRWGELEMDQAGLDVLSAGLGADWRVWSEKRSAVLLSLRSQVPIYQVVGDPWLAENGSLSLGIGLAL